MSSWSMATGFGALCWAETSTTEPVNTTASAATPRYSLLFVVMSLLSLFPLWASGELPGGRRQDSKSERRLSAEMEALSIDLRRNCAPSAGRPTDDVAGDPRPGYVFLDTFFSAKRPSPEAAESREIKSWPTSSMPV